MLRRAALAAALAALALAAGIGTCGLAPSAANRAEEIVFEVLGFELFLGLAACAAALLSRFPLRVRLGLDGGRLSRTHLGLLALGTLGLSLALDGLLDLSGLRAHSALLEFERELTGIRGRTLALALLGLGIAPGIAEEILCRGWIQRGLERPLGAPAAVVIAALAFGALHGDPVHGAFAAVIGLYLGAVAQLAGSVRAAIACHVANNLFAVATKAWDAGASVAPEMALPLGSVVAAGALWTVHRRAGGPSLEPWWATRAVSETCEEPREKEPLVDGRAGGHPAAGEQLTREPRAPEPHTPQR